MRTFTFYSFKGGVGRTALLTHLAVQWADRGRIVAIVDMDLNAPGISYSPLLQEHPDAALRERGASDLLATFYDMLDAQGENFGFFPPSRLLRDMKPPENAPRWGSRGRLMILPAGRVNLPQAQQFTDAEQHKIHPASGAPGETPAQRALRAFARKFKADLAGYTPPGSDRPIEYLLIDCRTGYPDLADLAMGYLADRIVLVSGFNHQNVKGLGLTLEALRPHRIKPGRLLAEALVVFSPAPANIHDHPEALHALEQGMGVLEAARQPLAEGEGDREDPPPVYTLPYTPHLAITDLPVPRKRAPGLAQHPYWAAVARIGDDLAPTESPEELTEALRRETQRVTGAPRSARNEAKGGAAPASAPDRARADARADASSDPIPGEVTPADLMRLPPWHWPFAGDPKKIDAFRERLPLGGDLADAKEQAARRERFLNGLCASTAHDGEEKRKLLRDWPELSPTQIDDLLEIFSKQRSQYAALPSVMGKPLIEILFDSQQAWAAVLLDDEKEGRRAMLERPLEGHRAFPTWAGHPRYWGLIAEKTVAAAEDGPQEAGKAPQALERLRAAVVDPAIPAWGRLQILANLPDANASQARRVLDGLRTRPWPKDHYACREAVEILWRWAELRDALEKFVIHVRKLTEEGNTRAHWSNFGYLLHEHLGRYEEAEQAYRRAIELDPKYAYPWNGLGNLLAAEHFRRYDEAERAYQRAIELDPENAGFWNRLGNLYSDQLGRFEKAEDAYRRAIQRNPKESIFWSNLGHLLQGNFNRFDEAERAYRRAIELSPKETTPWNGLGALYQYHLGRYEEAEAAFRKASELDPKSASPWEGLGEVLGRHMGRHEEAEDAFQKAKELDPDSASPWEGLGWLLGEVLGRPTKARDAFEKGLKIKPDKPFMSMNRGHLELQLGEPWRDHLEKALAGFERLHDAAAIANQAWLAVELNLLERMPDLKRLRSAMTQAAMRPCVFCSVAMWRLVRDEPMDPELKKTASLINNHASHRGVISEFFLLAGARPDLLEPAREAARFLYNLPKEQTAQFKDVFVPRLLERFRPFVDGETDGAGDPRNLPLFFPDYKP